MSNFRLFIEPIFSPGIVEVKVWVREGSRSDPRNKKGIHNLFLSLLSRGCGPYNNQEVADIIEGSGAELLSETYEDGLMISLKCTENKSYLLLTLLDYMITEPHLEQSYIDLERKLIIQSIKRQRENPFNLAFSQWKKIHKDGSPGKLIYYKL